MELVKEDSEGGSEEDEGKVRTLCALSGAWRNCGADGMVEVTAVVMVWLMVQKLVEKLVVW